MFDIYFAKFKVAKVLAQRFAGFEAATSPYPMPRDGFFCPLRSTTVNPAQQHTKDLRVFLFRVAHYPEMFEEFIDMFRDCWADLGEDVARHATDETEVPICVNASVRCSFMVPDAKRPKERKTIQI